MPKKKEEAPTTPKQLQAMINKRFGEGTVVMGSDPSLAVERIPTGILSLDLLTKGGFARNRHHELYGSANVGKTFTTFKHIAKAQSLGFNCAFFDVEKTFDPKFASVAGVDVGTLEYVAQRVHGNQLIDIMEAYLRAGMHDVIVLDSIAALLPKGELEKDMEAGSYGTEQAKMMSAALRRLTAANKNTVLVYINQTRDSIGSVFAGGTRTSGGRAMGFYAGMRLEFVRMESIKGKGSIIKPGNYDDAEADVVTGHRVLVKIKKNKTGGGTPESSTSFVFDYTTDGIDHFEELIYCGRLLGWVHKQGDYFWLDEHEDEKKHTRARFKKWLIDNPEISEKLQFWIENVDLSDEEEEDE